MLGLFDSGSGGLTVAKAIRAQAPMVDMVYVGDIANMPYGSKTVEELEVLTLRSMKFLRNAGATHLVSACNSISVSVVRSLIALVGAKGSTITEMVGPSIDALKQYVDKTIFVVATPATIFSGLYSKELQAFGVRTQSCALPDLARCIEDGEGEEVCRSLIARSLPDILAAKTDILVLGCTHYPFVRHLFEDELRKRGSEATIFDPAGEVAKAALFAHGSLGTGKTLVYTSKESPVFAKRVQQVFGDDVVVQRIDV